MVAHDGSWGIVSTGIVLLHATLTYIPYPFHISLFPSLSLACLLCNAMETKNILLFFYLE